MFLSLSSFYLEKVLYYSFPNLLRWMLILLIFRQFSSNIYIVKAIHFKEFKIPKCCFSWTSWEYIFHKNIRLEIFSNFHYDLSHSVRNVFFNFWTFKDTLITFLLISNNFTIVKEYSLCYFNPLIFACIFFMDQHMVQLYKYSAWV